MRWPWQKPQTERECDIDRKKQIAKEPQIEIDGKKYTLQEVKVEIEATRKRIKMKEDSARFWREMSDNNKSEYDYMKKVTATQAELLDEQVHDLAMICLKNEIKGISQYHINLVREITEDHIDAIYSQIEREREARIELERRKEENRNDTSD